MAMIRTLFIAYAVIAFLAGPAEAMVLTADTTWRETVRLSEDLLVPAGVTLTVVSGAVVKAVEAEGTENDPEYLPVRQQVRGQSA